MITISDGTITATLSSDLHWSDEFNWNPVEQNVSRTITGAMVVESALMSSGRPITLGPIDEDSAWTPYGELLKLKALALVPGKVMQLIMKGVTRNVMFRHHERDVIESKAVVHYSEPDFDDNYLVTVKLMEI